MYQEFRQKQACTTSSEPKFVILRGDDVTETKVIGGHPILVTPAEDAVKKWSFDSATAETTGTLEINFDTQAIGRRVRAKTLEPHSCLSPNNSTYASAPCC